MFCIVSRAVIWYSENRRADEVLSSRHARSNVKLYGITLDDISASILAPDTTQSEGSKLVALRKFRNKFSGYPLKVVYEESAEDVLIITVCPLKKKVWR